MPFFSFDPKQIPKPADTQQARLGWEHLCERVADNDALAGFAANLAKDLGAGALASSLFGNSPFLAQCIHSDPEFARDLFEKGPDFCRKQILDAVAAAATSDAESDAKSDAKSPPKPRDEAALKRHLRILKRRCQLTAAMGDVAGIWDLDKVTGMLSDFADAAVSAACRHLLGALAEKGAFRLHDPLDPEKGSGLVILGLGKLGGHELNYSSDIDIIILFDAERIDTDTPEDLQNHFVRLARKLVNILDDRTRDGYVFRTDLRLRPDPGSTPPAISTLAAETYYESIGQNWERAAMIKARPIAGDLGAGEAFIASLKPFVWRKSLDFDAIEDIHSIKRQINAHRGSATIELLGHNVKLGRGGIREIEFYAQTQQLIWGGRNRDLRTAPTQPSLLALAEAGHIKLEDANALIEAYRFLRKVEHRLQMINDEQTHSLPEDEEKIESLAIFLGFENGAAFSEKIIATLQTVEALYAHLFEDAPSLFSNGDARGNLVFTGSESDPDTLKTLQELGFKNVKAVDSTVRGWHHARYRSTRSTRARQLLTELMPTILSAFGRTPEPDSAFIRFDRFISQLPAGVQLFSMFQANPGLLNTLADIMGTAPRLAEHLAQKASVLDAVLSPDFYAPPPDVDALDKDLNRALEDATCLEEALDITRRWSKDRKFQIGLQVLKTTLNERESQLALSNIADALISALQPRVEAEFAIKHGLVPGGGLAVVAFGKYGGREKTPTSDLDLIFIYDFDASAEQSDGAKPLAPSQYFARLSQRLINALSAPTAEGALYEVDMRLRPSGASGPIASTVESFEAYQKNEAWTWEHMALTRARAVSGPPALQKRCEAVICEVLKEKRDADKLAVDVSDMRARIRKEHETDTPWAIKHYPGGMVDIEFLAQYLQLLNAFEHPEILSANTRVALGNLKQAGVLDATTADQLIQALDLWQSIQGLVRLTVVHDLRNQHEYEMPESLKRIFCAIGGVESMAELEKKMKNTAHWVSALFSKTIDAPAKAAAPQGKTP